MEAVLAALINEKGITMTYTAGAPQHILYKQAPGYTVVLRCSDKVMGIPFHTGCKDIEVIDVLSYLLIRSDAMDLTYQQYCRDFEYYSSNKIKRLYYYDRMIGERLKDFLGADFEKFRENNDY